MQDPVGSDNFVLSDGCTLDDLIDLEMNEVSLRVMSDPELHRIEMERVFAKTWLLLGHDSEIPEAGDYVVRSMGEDPVIVARGKNGEVHVSLNVCPHRGMRICTAETGNAMVHRCIYHGWAFRPDGSFIGAPIEKEQMHGSKRSKDELGLPKARVHLYHGLIFATWNVDGPSFEEFLGTQKFYLDMLFKRTDAGQELLGPPQRFIIAANWKTACEQSASDGFHTLTLHRSLMVGDGPMGSTPETIYDQAPGMYGVDISSTEGHSLRCMPMDKQFTSFAGMDFSQDDDALLQALPPPGLTPELALQAKHHLSPEQLHLLATNPPQVGGMFPNVLIIYIYVARPDGTMSPALALHTYQPRGPGKFEFFNFILAEKDAPEELKRDMLENAIRQTGTSGMIEQDDADTWPQIMRSSYGPKARKSTLKYQAIAGHEIPDGWPGPGLIYEGFTKDDTQWNWWLNYHRLMSTPA